MRKLIEVRRLRYALMLSIGLISAIIPLLSRLGMQFGSEIPGGPGIHFATWQIGALLVQIDFAIMGIVFFTATMAVAYLMISNSRFVLQLGATLFLVGMAQSFQILPLTVDPTTVGYGSAVVWATALSRFGGAFLLLLGALLVRTNKSRRSIMGLLKILAPGLILLFAVWVAMARVPVPDQNNFRSINLGTLGLYAAAGLLFKSELHYHRLRMFGQGVLGSLLPLAVGQVGLTFLVTSHMDSAYQISILLQWFACMLPGGGLIVDFLNTYHARGLVQERQYLRSVIDAIPHFIFARDTNGIFTLVNQAVADFYGMKVHQVEGRHLERIHSDKEQCQLWLEEDLLTLKKGHKWILPQTSTTKANGQRIWITSLKMPLNTRPGKPGQVLGVSIDNTEEKISQIALDEQLKLEKATSEINEAFALCTPDNFFANMNTVLGVLASCLQASRCFVYSVDESVDEEGSDTHLIHAWTGTERGAFEALPNELSGDELAWLLRRFKMDAPVSPGTLGGLPAGAEPFKKAWGQPDDIGFLAVPIFSQGRFFGFLGLDSNQRQRWEHKELGLMRMVVDLFITVWSKHEVERSLVLATEAAESSNQAKSDFLANMSHEIRTPLNCVIGIADLLVELDPTPLQKQYVEMIQTSGDALLTLINDLLDLAKVESGKLELDEQEIDLQELADEVTSLSAFSAQASGLELVSRLGSDVPSRVVADGNRLRQVLVNLMSNAVKFTREGHIYLNVEAIGQSEGTPRLRFQVKDTGFGISPDSLRKIFDKFTQADTSTTRRFGGTGLGLSISRQLVELMGGDIQAESVVGEGSVFSFTLPLVKVEYAPREKVAAGGRILVISARRLSGTVLAEQIQRLGYECRLVESAREAKELLGIQPGRPMESWAGVLVDESVDDEFQNEINEHFLGIPLNLRPRTILMSNVSSVRRKLDLEQRGFAGVLPKPVLHAQLLQVLSGEVFKSDDSGIPSTAAEELSKPTSVSDNGQAPLDEGNDWSPRVLLAEDNVFNQKVAVGILEILGCRVEVASHGAEALEMVKADAFDLIFMDCQMPEMDGFEATRKIRELDEPRNRTPIIAMTANTMSADKKACYAAGMDDFVSKPINRSVLAEVLAKWEKMQVL
ncbi:MAG: response regulator [Gemmatimonadales bacterium]|nr:response regulator [Gemmatimonadales bacterium]